MEAHSSVLGSAGTMDTQRRLVVHAAIVLLVALACGLPSVVEVAGGNARMWQGAHAALLILAVWILATAALLPVLALPVREAAGLNWSLVAAGYSFMVAVIVQAVTGVRAFAPEGGPATTVAFVANLVAVLSSFVAAGLTLAGALNALKGSPKA